MIGVTGGIVVGSVIGGVIAGWWGVTAPFWFAFVGSAIILVLIWRSLAHIPPAHQALVQPRRASDGSRPPELPGAAGAGRGADPSPSQHPGPPDTAQSSRGEG